MIHIRWMSSVETSYSMGTMNKDDILRLTDRGMAIFKHYLPTPFRVGRNFLNPLYEDKHASCNIYYGKSKLHDACLTGKTSSHTRAERLHHSRKRQYIINMPVIRRATN